MREMSVVISLRNCCSWIVQMRPLLVLDIMLVKHFVKIVSENILSLRSLRVWEHLRTFRTKPIVAHFLNLTFISHTLASGSVKSLMRALMLLLRHRVRVEVLWKLLRLFLLEGLRLLLEVGEVLGVALVVVVFPISLLVALLPEELGVEFVLMLLLEMLGQSL